MTLLNLPLELFSQILETAFLGADIRTLRGATNLRLVCRTFDHEILDVFARTKFLYRDFNNFEKKPESAVAFLTRYLLQRPHLAPEPNTNFSSLANYIVDELLNDSPHLENKDHLRYQHMYRLVDWVGGCNAFWKIIPLIFPEKGPIDVIPHQYSLFTAAIYLKGQGIVQDMLQDPKLDLKTMTSEIFHTPMQAAIESGQQEIVLALLEHGIDINTSVKDYWFPSPLTLAINTRNESIAYIFLEPQYGLDTSSETFEHSILAALKKNYPALAHILLNRFTGSLPNCRYLLSDGLRTACRNGMVDIVKQLLDNGGDPNEHLSYNRNVICPPLLGQAAWTGQIEVMHLLLERGADVRIEGAKTMGAAAWGCQINAVKILIDAGIKKEDFSAAGVLDRALNSMKPQAGEYLRLLQDHGLVNIFHLDDNQTPSQDLARLIVIASMFGNLGFLQAINDYGANLDEPTKFPPPITIAKRCGQDDVVAYLRSLGVKDVEPDNQTWKPKPRRCNMPWQA